jgi:hypothetical protein
MGKKGTLPATQNGEKGALVFLATYPVRFEIITSV